MIKSIQTADIDNLLHSLNHCESDAKIATLLRSAKTEMHYSDWKKIEAEFTHIADFYLDSDESFLRSLARKLSISSQKDRLKVNLENKYSINGKLDLEGVELSNTGSNLYCLFGKDASEEGRFRFSVFSAHGFMSHTTRDSYEELLTEALEDGFIKQADGALNTCSSNPEFFKSHH